jgi:hypothetical protein
MTLKTKPRTRIYERYGSWAVTPLGLEHLGNPPYVIEKHRLWEGQGYWQRSLGSACMIFVRP